jgi:aryl-alcohol dehydrogenase
MSVTAAVTEVGGAPFALREVELDSLRPDEVLVKIAACGVCHTDLSLRDQLFPSPLPIVLGHEGAGVVEAIGDRVTRVAPGDRVTLTYNSCGHCRNCLGGVPAHCYEHAERNFGSQRTDGTTAITLDGQRVASHFFGQSSFATHAVAVERTVLPIADDVPFELVAPFGCGVQTGAGTVMNVFRPQAGTALAVFGAGCVGMSAVMAGRVVGCAQVIAVDLVQSRLDLALELGATHVVNAADQDPVAAIQEITGGGAEFSLDATGVPAVLRQAVECTRPLGTTAIVGSPAPGSELPLDIIAMIITGRTVVGVAEGRSLPQVFIPRLLDLWRQGRFPVDRIIETFPFEQINEAAEAAHSGAVIKPVLTMA